MGADEFDDEAAAVVDEVRGADLDDRIAAACRGSGNPAALAWLAEGLRLRAGTVVVDVGAGLGGPAAWLARHFGCRVVAADPAEGAAAGGGRLFDVPFLRATAAELPLRRGAGAVAVVLGVLSVVRDPVAVLREARRVADAVGILEWCSTEADGVHAGGSRFPTPDELHASLGEAGWTIEQSVPFAVPAPAPWQAAAERADVGTSDDEAEVEAAIDAGRLRVQLVVASRAP